MRKTFLIPRCRRLLAGSEPDKALYPGMFDDINIQQNLPELVKVSICHAKIKVFLLPLALILGEFSLSAVLALFLQCLMPTKCVALSFSSEASIYWKQGLSERFALP